MKVVGAALVESLPRPSAIQSAPRSTLNRASTQAQKTSSETGTARGQSEVLGIAFLVAIVVIATTVLGLYGVGAIYDQQNQLSIPQAERALEQLDAQASSVALGESEVQEIDLGIGSSSGALETNPTSGWMRVRAVHPVDDDKLIVNETLGAVTYRVDDESIAFQAGGIWYGQDGNSVMRAPPEFHYSDKTLVIPIIATRGDGGVYSQVQIAKEGDTVREFPDASQGLVNKLEDQNAPTIEVTVQSEYYEAWAEFFREETDGGVVTVSHNAESTTLLLPTLAGQMDLDIGVISTSGAGRFFVAGNSEYINSYNSSNGTYSETRGPNAILRSAGDVEMQGTADVSGDIQSGGNVSLSGNAVVTGDVNWTESCTGCDEDSVDGTVNRIDGVDPIPTVEDLVNIRVNRTQRVNDNNNTSVINNNQVSPGVLGPGNYYVDNIDLESGETLVLNTTTGDVTLAVEDWIKVGSGGGGGGGGGPPGGGGGGGGAEIRVEGDGIARIFVASRDTVQVSPTGFPGGQANVHLHVGKGSGIEVPEENSSQLRMYGPTPFRATVAGSTGQPARFEGILYAPAGRNGTGYIWVKHGDVFGAVAVGEVTAGQGAGIHFDHATSEALLNILPDVSDVDYMHVSRRNISITAN